MATVVNNRVLGEAKRRFAEFQAAVKASTKRDGEAAPATAEKPPRSNAEMARDALVNDICKKREEETGRPLTPTEKRNVQSYVDTKIASQGEGATAASIPRAEQEEMGNFAASADEDVLAAAGGAPMKDKGPVGMAAEAVPGIVTSDVPYPPYKPEPTPPQKPTSDDPAAQEKYQEDCKKYNKEKKQVQKENKKLKKEYDKAVAAEKPDLQKVESALATGAMKLDKTDDGKTVVQYLDKNEGWIQKVCENEDEAKQLAKTVANKCISPTYTQELPADTLAAIAAGDIVMRPDKNGKNVEMKVKEKYDENGNPIILGDNNWHVESAENAIKDANDAAKGYQQAAGVDYSQMDQKITAEDKADAVKKAAEQASTDGTGVARCPVCGQPWQAAQQMVVADDAPVQANKVEFALPAIMRRSSNMVVRQKNREVVLSEKAKEYKKGYSDWYRVDATAQLTNVVLDNHPSAFTEDELLSLSNEIVNTLEGTDLIAAFVERMDGEQAIANNPDRKANIEAIKNTLANKYDVSTKHHSVNMAARGTCPMCGSAQPDGSIYNPETVVAQSSYKGQNDAKTYMDMMGTPYLVVSGWQEFFRDGSQQAVNPFTHQDGRWTKFSFRPSDAMEGYPIISITPASFQSILSFPVMLNMTPYVVISEYFMRNNVANGINALTALTKGIAKILNSGEAGEQGEIMSDAKNLLAKVADKLVNVSTEEMVITQPFILYHRLKGKIYGNRYILPYIPEGNTIVEADNSSEWGGDSIFAQVGAAIQGVLNGVAGAAGVGVAKLMPAPTWKLPESGNTWQMHFTLNLINDEFIRSRNNYMCANTIINNNRWIQKSIIGFPGALYEVLVPTGVRELMCTGAFKLTSVGTPRHAPKDFFLKPFFIGVDTVVTPKNVPMHQESYEVIPDTYELDCTFKSAIQENLNNSVFAYYLDIATFAPGTATSSALEDLVGLLGKDSPEEAGGLLASVTKARVSSDTPQGVNELVDGIKSLTKSQAEKNEAEKDDGGDGGTKSQTLRSVKSRDVVEDENKLYNDAISISLRRRYAELKEKLVALKRGIADKTAQLELAKQKQQNSIPSLMRKALVKKISKLSQQVNALLTQQDALWNEMIDLEMEIFQHGHAVIEHHTRDDTLEVPKDYFEIPVVDAAEALKIQLMTRAEKQKYIIEKNNEIAKLDQWGVSECADFYPRCCVAMYILDLIKELELVIRDVQEIDTKSYDEYMYRKDMLWADFKVVMDPEIPFILNKTNLVYVPLEYIPEEWRPTTPEDEDDEDSSVADEIPETPSDTTDIVVPEENAIIQITPEERAEIIKKHRDEVIKLKFGDENGLHKAAYNNALTTNQGISYHWGLVHLRSNPQIASTDMAAYFAELGQNWNDLRVDHPTWPEYNCAIFLSNMQSEGSTTKDLANKTREDSIAIITDYFYQLINSSEVVLVGNAMNEDGPWSAELAKNWHQASVIASVDDIARKALTTVTDEIHRD